MDELEQIRQKIDIVSLISEYLPLKKAGRNFRINCPFHSEKTPSFTVSPERQIFHCFGCSIGGDIFTFLMKYENIEFPEALRMLATRAGIELKRQIFDSKTSKTKEKIYQINHLASEFYHYLLTRHPSGKKALDYLKKRNINQAAIRTFKLGFVPNLDNSLTRFLIGKKKYTMSELADAGLVVAGRDRFRNRIIFPLTDHRENIVGFSGRILSEGSGLAKYINTPETLVYRKGDFFYALDKAKDAIKKEKQALIVEGEFDVISSFQNGINNIVAIKGTALTENQANLIRRFTDKVSLCLDQDTAGEIANKRGIEILENVNLYVSVVKLHLGKDPDESLRENPTAFKKAIEAPLPIYDFIIESALSHWNPAESLGKMKISSEVVPFLAKITNEIIKDHYIKKLAQALDASVESVMLEIEKLSKKQVLPAVYSIKKDKKDREEVLAEYLLALVVQSPNPGSFMEKITAEDIALPLYQKIFTYLKEFIVNHKFSIKKFVQFVPAELVPAIDKSYLLVLPNDLNEEKYALEVEKTLKDIHTISLRKKLREIAEKIKMAEVKKNEEELGELQKLFEKLTTQLNAAFSFSLNKNP